MPQGNEKQNKDITIFQHLHEEARQHCVIKESILPSPSNSLATLRARDEATSGAFAAGIITSKIASACSAYSLTYEKVMKTLFNNFFIVPKAMMRGT